VTDRNRRVRHAALLGCAASIFFVPGALAAQAAEPPRLTAGAVNLTANDAQDAEIVVTGSRVRGEAPVGSPVISLGRDQITASGAVTIDRVIKEIPQSSILASARIRAANRVAAATTLMAIRSICAASDPMRR